ncbi:beta-caryophyllene synthase [Tanacetum coccineum]
MIEVKKQLGIQLLPLNPSITIDRPSSSIRCTISGAIHPLVMASMRGAQTGCKHHSIGRQGSCVLHVRSRSVIAKVTKLGYYWLTMHQDEVEEIRKCETCQIHSLVLKFPKQDITSVTSSWLFCQWDIDIVGPLQKAPGKSSYANITGKPSGKKVNVHTLFTPGGYGIDVVVPVDSIRTICERFANTAYDFFLGKKIAYPIVVNYVTNTWGKYGLVRSMFSSSTRLFSFQFSSMDGLDAMLENGPWFICNNPLILKKWHPNENLLKEDVSSVPVWVKLYGVPVTAFNEDGLSDIATKLGTPLMLDSYTSDMCMQSWGRSSYARVMIELRSSYARVMIELKVDVELKDNIVVAMPKITREGHYTCNVRVEFEWKPLRCSSYKVFGHVHVECTKNTEYRPVTRKPNASSSGNKKKGVELTIEVSNSNPFDVLNSVDNDGEFGTNGGTNNLVNNKATSSGSSFMNIDNDGECANNTLIGVKIDKIIRQIGEGKLRLLDNDGNPLVSMRIMESDSEVELRDSYPDNDDYDLYDDDMYENHDLSEHLQSICDDLDIMVLSAYRNMSKSSHEETSFNLTSGSEAVDPAEISVGTERTQRFVAESNHKRLREI